MYMKKNMTINLRSKLISKISKKNKNRKTIKILNNWIKVNKDNSKLLNNLKEEEKKITLKIYDFLFLKIKCYSIKRLNK
jgi:hypothetical protein